MNFNNYLEKTTNIKLPVLIRILKDPDSTKFNSLLDIGLIVWWPSIYLFIYGGGERT